MSLYQGCTCFVVRTELITDDVTFDSNLIKTRPPWPIRGEFDEFEKSKFNERFACQHMFGRFLLLFVKRKESFH